MNKIEQNINNSLTRTSNELPLQNVDRSQMNLFLRIWYYVKVSARKTCSVCTTAGEKLAWFFGITKPKYHAEIQHYENMNEEQREIWRQAFQDIEHPDHIRESIR